MKKYLISLLFVGVSISVFAQLEVNSDGKVKIASNLNTSNYNLLVGNNSFGSDLSNVGISGSTAVMNYKRNIGVIGTISAESNLTNETNMGVCGIVSPIENTHGRNFGLCGMLGNYGDSYSGAGIYATNYTFYFSHPTNIQGTYAGYFQGDVKVTGTLTIPNMFIPSDSRLNENIVLLNDRGQQTNTLGNLLSMNVIEYNTKSRIKDEFPDGIGRDATAKEREAYECLKKDEMKMSSRRHYGIDAEELQKVYPDLVLEGQDGYLSVNYVELVPILIRSIQELKQELDEVKGEAKAMTRSVSDETADFNAAAKNNVLYQNTPNPFKEQTAIRFNLADDVQDASICIFDMTGKTLKKLPISSGMESVSIGGYELGEGMFLYSLIVNGQVIDTKRMVISK
jgi:hypothetical protein